MELTMIDGNKLLIDKLDIQEIHENSSLSYDIKTKKFSIHPGGYTVLKWKDKYLRVLETKKEIESF